jgi:hypothetical protein
MDTIKLKTAIVHEDLEELRMISTQPMGFQTTSQRREAWSLLLHINDLPAKNDYYDLAPELTQQLDLDINRSFNQFPNLLEEVKILHRKSLGRVMGYLFQRYNYLHYYQGFHDICSIFILVQGESLAKKSLAVIMNVYLRDFMESKMTGTMLNLGLMMNLMEKVDKKLYDRCNTIEGFEPFFGVSWFLTWFSHHLDEFKSSRLFDVIISKGPIFVIYISVVVFEFAREQVLECEEVGEVLEVMCGLDFDNLDVELIISKANDYHMNYKLDTKILGHYSCVNTFKKFENIKPGTELNFKTFQKYSVNISSSRINSTDPNLVMKRLMVGAIILSMAVFLVQRRELFGFPR